MRAAPVVFDTAALILALDKVRGRRLLGCVPSWNAVELVYEDGPGRPRCNLVTIYTAGWDAGQVALGAVDNPDAYARLNRWPR